MLADAARLRLILRDIGIARISTERIVWSTPAPTEDHLELQPWFEADNYRQLAQYEQLDAAARTLLDSYRENGFVILEQPGIGASTLDGAIRSLQDKYTQSATGYSEGGRRQDAWKFSDEVRSIATSPTILGTLRQLYGREPIPFQTLNFQKATEQRAHSDTVHFNTLPHGFMCGVWVALEDVDAGNGPLFYYPGSQRLPVYHMHDLGLPAGYGAYRQYEDKIEAILRASPYRATQAHLKKGQALIWSHNIFHGGSRVLDRSRTRLSQVTHFYFPGCIYYTPMLSEPLQNKWTLRRVADIRTGKRIPAYDGVSPLMSRAAAGYRKLRGLLGRQAQ
jgi:phytanoyl-CoA dioxygenase PhyH